ncbi:FAD-dependent oxidoreductase [Hufsiella ginkgonis]|uniref:Tryptophan 2-monooxygenase n=1 Tax=Hufsiella ginkgonis TaxID=2695274 RepID=A0A7K1XSE6_9SPHI|nr:FAD-dependent oxidoreductase [Hufsiella ginkgonis]MXV13884.1 NAD(P)-binding protein [Hufsiella ginkgonis]
MSHFTSLQLKSAGATIPAYVSTLIVGAGMSGLYSAWRILDNDPQADLVILEQSGRTGGRLDSDLIEFSDGETVKEEEGGMRFTFDSMDNLMALFMILDIDGDIVPFPMSTGGNNRLCFRGASFNNTISAENNYAIWKELYNLAPSEQGINPTSIIDTVFNRILAANPQFTDRPKVRTPEFWQKFRLECKWNGVGLINWTLWNLYTEMGYSKECINMLYGLAGFNGTFLSTMNAGEAYQLLEDFPADPDFKTLKEGFSTLPNALVKQIEKDGKGRIFLDTMVASIDEYAQDGYVVSYRYQTSDNTLEEGRIKAGRVILGIPRLPLEKLFNRSNALNKLPLKDAEYLWDTLQTTTNQALLKINLYFDHAWWGTNLTGQPSVGYGPNFSDLPTGAVYPFYAIDEPTIASLEYEKFMQQAKKPIPEHLRSKLENIANSKFNKPAALTIYCDYLNINFWKALQNNGAMFTSPMQEEFNQQVPQKVFAASEAVVEAAIGFFKQLFNTNYIPTPVLTSARIWEGSSLFNLKPSEQFDYGVHQWGLNADDKTVMAYLAEPMPNLHICGEAYSDYQGWVEGALRSANLVLEKAFGLKPVNEVYQQEHGQTPTEAVTLSYANYAGALIKEYIDPDFNLPADTGQLVAAESKKESPLFGINLTYFDQPE